MEKIPKTIWMYWEQGWDNAPEIIKQCRKSWERENPNWRINALDSSSASKYVNLEKYSSLKKEHIQSFSDILRINLLKECGGVWVDATTFCSKPLDEWLPTVMTSGFFAFAKPGCDRLVSSWFLATVTDNAIVKEWAKLTEEYWESRKEPDEYYWFHYLFEEGVNKNAEMKNIWKKTPYVSSYGSFAIFEMWLKSILSKRIIRKFPLVPSTSTVFSNAIAANSVPVHKFDKNMHVSWLYKLNLISQPPPPSPIQ